MHTYEAVRIQGAPQWEQIPVAPLENYLWSDVRSIQVQAQMAWDPEALYVRLEAVEPEILCRFDGHLDEVCRDSCLEFFFCPADGDRYFNFEANPNGSLYVGYGKPGSQRARLYRTNWRELFQVAPYRTDDGWGISLRIPVSFVDWFVPGFHLEQGMTLRGNFFKCGDDTAQEHYMSWNKVDVPHPNFHLPEFFGNIVLK